MGTRLGTDRRDGGRGRREHGGRRTQRQGISSGKGFFSFLYQDGSSLKAIDPGGRGLRNATRTHNPKNPDGPQTHPPPLRKLAFPNDHKNGGPIAKGDEKRRRSLGG